MLFSACHLSNVEVDKQIRFYVDSQSSCLVIGLPRFHGSLVCPTLKKKVWENCVQKIGAAGMLVAPIKSLAFDLRHQVFINTLRFTGFDNKMDTMIETAVQKLGYIEAKSFQTKSTFLRSFEFDNAAPHKRQHTDLMEYSSAIFDSLAAQTAFFFYMGEGKEKGGLSNETTFTMCRDYYC